MDKESKKTIATVGANLGKVAEELKERVAAREGRLPAPPAVPALMGPRVAEPETEPPISTEMIWKALEDMGKRISELEVKVILLRAEVQALRGD